MCRFWGPKVSKTDPPNVAEARAEEKDGPCLSPPVDGENPGVPLKGSIRVPLRAPLKGSIGFRDINPALPIIRNIP